MKTLPDLSAFIGAPALVIDDDRPSREILSDLLYELGFKNVVEAPSGEDALHYLNKHPEWRGIILCDWNMPNMTGAELYAHVKKNNPDVPFIMVTGRNDEDSVIYAKDSGIYAYILKPFSLQELGRKVAKVSLNHATYLKPPNDQEQTPLPYHI